MLVAAGGETTPARSDEKEQKEPERLVLKAANVVIAPGKSIPRGVIIIEDNKISAVGTDLGVPRGARLRDFGNNTIVAGFVDCQTDCGADRDITDTTRSLTPAVRAVDAYRAEAPSLRAAARAGICTIGLAPIGENIAAGYGAVAKTHGPVRSVRDEAFLKFSFSHNAFDGDRFPTTFAAGVVALDASLKSAGNDPAKATNAESRALARARKELTSWFEVDDATDVRRVIQFAKNAGLRPVIVALSDITDAAAEIAAAKIPVVFAPIHTNSPKAMFRAPVALAKAGAEFAFATLGSQSDLQPGVLLESARLAAASGIDAKTALASITTIPAKMLGVDDRIGTIETGRDADLVVMSGEPVNATSAIIEVFVKGVSVRPAVEK